MKIILRLFFIFFSFLSFAQINDSNVNLLINKISQTEAKGDTTSNDYANLINNLAIYYTNKGMYTQAEPLFIKVSTIRKSVYGENHLSYATSLNNLAFLYQKQGRYIEAEPVLLKSLQIEKSILGSDNSDYLDSYEMLGFLYENLNKYDYALKVFNEVLQTRKNNKNKSYIVTFSNIIRVKCSIDDDIDYDYLENLCKKYLSETENILGKKDPFYLIGLFYLASFYEHNNVLYLAEKKYEEIIDIKKNILKEDINSIYPTYESLANIYNEEGNYQLAERIHQFVLDKKVENNLSKYEIARSYNNLATVYMNQFKYNLALSNYLLAIELIEKENSLERQDYATYLNNIGLLYIKLEKYEVAENYLFKALEIHEKISGQFSNGYLMVCSNLGALYEKLDRCKDAESYYLISINNSQNKNSANFKDRFLNLSKVYQCLNDIDNEKKYLIKSSEFFINNLSSIIYNYSNYQTELILNDIINSKNFPLSFLNRNTKDKEIARVALNEELILKNLSVKNQNRIKNYIKKSNNDTLKMTYIEYIQNKKILLKLNELDKLNRPKEYDELVLKTEELEKYLVQNSKVFSHNKILTPITFNQIYNQFKNDEIFINIVSYNYYDKGITDSILYSAFILKKDSKFPQFIPLFEEKQLNTILEQNKNLSDRSKIDINYQEKALSNLLLKPLENELKGISTIYLSLSGLTHQINVAALPVNENQTFGQKYKIHILNSPSELIDYTATSFDKKEKLDFILYGGIDYDKKINISPTDRNLAHFDEEIKALQTRSGISSFGYLSATKNEIENISTLANKSNLKAIIFEDRNATEESIKQLDGRTIPFVLHLATHGFFFPDPVIESSNDKLFIEGKSKIFKSSDDPMMRSGLVFSGANKSWGKSNENQSEDDGILTANEISNLDLSACQLVVLSACETGLGEVKGSEGVFGLQRAFKMAGVKNIIMSLWKVPDTQTAELFNIFYSECFAGKTIHEAFKMAQSKMKEKYSPYYWAGFVLLE